MEEEVKEGEEKDDTGEGQGPFELLEDEGFGSTPCQEAPRDFLFFNPYISNAEDEVEIRNEDDEPDRAAVLLSPLSP